MTRPAAIMRELHRLQTHAKDLRTEIDRGPKTLKLHQEKLAKQEEQTREVHESLKRVKVAIHEKEVSLKSKQQAIDKHERQLNEAGSKKEYDALKAEIASDKRISQQLEDQILESMEDLDRRTAQLPEVDRALDKAKKDLAQLIEDIQNRRQGLVERLNDVLKQLKDVAATLPPDVQVQYERLATAHGDDALSSVNGRTCKACYTEITAQCFNNLMQGQYVACKSCGRILYLPEDTEGARETA